MKTVESLVPSKVLLTVESLVVLTEKRKVASMVMLMVVHLAVH